MQETTKTCEGLQLSICAHSCMCPTAIIIAYNAMLNSKGRLCWIGIAL